MRVYIASPFFTPEQYQNVEDIKSMLDKLNIEYYSPKDDSLVPKDADDATRQKIFQQNLDEIDKCDFMIANLRDKDIGTYIEIGVAYARSKKVIAFIHDTKKINLMLSQLMYSVAYGVTELESALSRETKQIWEGEVE